VVVKSTVPIGETDRCAAVLRERRPLEGDVRVAFNPEFLREGTAIADFMHPDRIVIGCADAGTTAMLHDLYAALDAPVIDTDVRTAEMIKYAANSFLATKISFVNEIAGLCERVGVDVNAVVAGAGADVRIGTAFFNAGLGFGGSCLPKDVVALARLCEQYGVTPHILDAVVSVNAMQTARMCDRLATELDGLAGRRIAVLGLAYKPDTDDVRESRSIALIGDLLAAGAIVTAHDPVAAENARRVLPATVTIVDDPYAACAAADAVVIATDWDAYRALDLARLQGTMAGSVMCDGRNLFDPAVVADAGFAYLGVGRRRSGKTFGENVRPINPRRAAPGRRTTARSSAVRPL
jgi:UDPglucose 6-dehydrogenase